jgi:hypothetical protein
MVSTTSSHSALTIAASKYLSQVSTRQGESMKVDKLFNPPLWFGVLLLIGIGVYAAGMSIPYYGDDYQTVFDLSPQWSFWSFFARNIPESGFYRPIQNSVLWLIQQAYGLNTLPIHTLQLAMHVSLSWLVFMFMRDLKVSGTMAALGSLTMLTAQTNGAALLGNDTMSQVMSTLFGFLSLYLVLHSHLNSGGAFKPALGRRGYVLSIAALAIAMLSKESGVMFFVLVVAVISGLSYRGGLSTDILKIIVWSLPFALVTGAYLLVRAKVAGAQPAFGPGNYDFALGANIIRNLALLAAGVTLPVSSVTVFTALKSGSTAIIVGSIVVTAIFLAMVGRGLVASRELYRPMLLCVVFFILALFPMVLLNHVSELHTYNAMPLASVLFGVGLGKCLDLPWKSRMMGTLINGMVLLLFISQIAAVRSKARQMEENGERSTQLISQITPYLNNVPAEGKLLLLNPCDDWPEYSVFRMKGFNVLQWGTHRFNQIAGRKDFNVEILEECRVPTELKDGRNLFLSLGPQGVSATDISQQPPQ